MASVAGLLIGLLPLVAVNAYSWSTTGRLISAAEVLLRPGWKQLPEYVTGYLSLGGGAELRTWILGDKIALWSRIAEGCLILGLLIVVFLPTNAHKDSSILIAGANGTRAMAGAYLLCMLGTWLLPSTTGPHLGSWVRLSTTLPLPLSP